MARISEISNVYLKEIEATLAQSELLLQRNRPASGQDGEGKSSGDLAEQFVRRLIRQLNPRSRYVTSGYIVDPTSFNAEENLPQFDVIVGDSTVPPIFSIINDQVEIVPVEGIVAVIEVKRTLSTTTLNEATEKLEKARVLFDRNGRTKTEPSKTVVTGSLMPGTQSPVLGIVGLENGEFDAKSLNLDVVDFAWAVKGRAVVAADESGRVSHTVSRESHGQTTRAAVQGDQSHLTATMIAVLRSWLATSTGQWLKPERIHEYYLKRR